MVLVALALGAGSIAQSGPALWAVGALSAWAALQAFTSISADPVASLECSVILAAMTGLLLFWRQRATRHGASESIAWVLVSVGLLQSVFGLLQSRWTPGRVYGMVTTSVGSYGSFVNRNHFAAFVGMTAFVGIGLALETARRRGLTPRFILAATLGLGLMAMALASGSRGGLVALAVGGVALLWMAGVARGRLKLWVAAPALVAALAIGLFMVPAATRQRLLTVATGPFDASASYRVAMTAATTRLFLEHPLVGSGLGSFSDVVGAHKRGHGTVRSTHAENDVFEFFGEAGLFGVCLLAWVVYLLWPRPRGAPGSGHQRRPGLRAGATAALVGLGAHSLLDFNLHIPSNALLAMTIAGIATARHDEAPRQPAVRTRRVVALLAIALACLSGWRAWGAHQLASAQSAESALAQAASLDRLVAMHPYLAEAQRARGVAHRAAAGWQEGYDRLRLERARLAFEDALSLRPRWGEVWADLGWTLGMLDDANGADAAFARAVALDPTHVGIGTVHAEFLGRSGRPEEGIRELERLLRENPSWSASWAVSHARRWTSSPVLLDQLRD
jgi:O-antigen ligase